MDGKREESCGLTMVNVCVDGRGDAVCALDRDDAAAADDRDEVGWWFRFL